MSLFDPIIIFALLGLTVASLLLVREMDQRKEETLVRLHRLSTLEKRSAKTRRVIAGLLELEDDPRIQVLLHKSLLEDLATMTQLDPGRGDIRAELQKIKVREKQLNEQAAKKNAAGVAANSMDLLVIDSLNSETTISEARGRLREAVTILKRLYKYRRIDIDQFRAAGERLKTLNLYVSINSCMISLEKAASRNDRNAALVYYGRARDLLASSFLPPAEKEQALRNVAAHQEQFFARLQNADVKMVARMGSGAGA